VLHKLPSGRLPEWATLRGQENQASLLPPADPGNGLKDRLRFEHHASAAPIGPIVHDRVTIVREGAKVMNDDFHHPAFLGPLENAFRKRPLKETGKEGEDVIAPQFRSSLLGDGPA
jgi:hypothetical protein